MIKISKVNEKLKIDRRIRLGCVRYIKRRTKLPVVTYGTETLGILNGIHGRVIERRVLGVTLGDHNTNI